MVQQLLLPLQCIADTLSSSDKGGGSSAGATDCMRVEALLQHWPLLLQQVTQQVQAEEITLGEAHQCCCALVTLVQLPVVCDALGSSAATGGCSGSWMAHSQGWPPPRQQRAPRVPARLTQGKGQQQQQQVATLPSTVDTGPARLLSEHSVAGCKPSLRLWLQLWPS
jgi:hypothetical protein